MPRLQRLSGKDVIEILRTFGFEVYSQKGAILSYAELVQEEKKP